MSYLVGHQFNSKYGELTLLQLNAGYKEYSTGRKSLALIKCFCDKEFTVVLAAVISGNTKSCGCVSLKGKDNPFFKHGLTNTREHNIWKGIKSRCDNPNVDDYKYYGGRGVSYCEEWKDFLAFLKWWNTQPLKDEENITVDRIDNTKDYCPNNCQLLSHRDNCLKQSQVKWLIHPTKGTFCLTEVGKIENIGRSTIRYHIKRNGHFRGWTYVN
jgi:hypothetical protein